MKEQKYRYEFYMPDFFEVGFCDICPLAYLEDGEDEYGDWDVKIHCVLGCNYEECPLQEIT